MSRARTALRVATATRADASVGVAAVRIVVGAVFLSEGIQKFLFAEELGVGRFAKIGIPAPQLLAPFVGAVEILGGTLLVLGLFSRLACVPLLVDMLVAISTTKLASFGKNSFWKTAHEARTDVLMIAGIVMILSLGAGPLSLDARLARRFVKPSGPPEPPP